MFIHKSDLGLEPLDLIQSGKSDMSLSFLGPEASAAAVSLLETKSQPAENARREGKTPTKHLSSSSLVDLLSSSEELINTFLQGDRVARLQGPGKNVIRGGSGVRQHRNTSLHFSLFTCGYV